MLQVSRINIGEECSTYKYLASQLLRPVLFDCFVALGPLSTAMVMVGQSVHLTTLFPGQV